MRAPTRGARAASTAPTRDWLMTIDGPPDWAITMFVKSVFFMRDSIAQRGIGRVARERDLPQGRRAGGSRLSRPFSADRCLTDFRRL